MFIYPAMVGLAKHKYERYEDVKELKRDERDRKYRKRGKENLEVGFEGWGRYHFQFAAIIKACECKARRAQKPNNSGFLIISYLQLFNYKIL